MMMISREERVRMERAHVLAWPALRTAVVHGWLWRSSGGGSQRANSVSTIDFHGADLEAALADVEARYLAYRAPTRFQTFDETSPPLLTAALQARGYRESEPTVTMFKLIENAGPVTDVEEREHSWADWRECYLGEITPNRQAVNTRILDRIPRPRAFFGHRRDGEIVSTALAVVGCGCAVIECVATRADARRQGAAHTVLTAVQSWAARQDANLIGLQVVATNTPALALYRRLGFVAGAANRFWALPAMPGRPSR